MGYPKDVWLNLYKHAVAEDYSFMYLNCKKPKKLRIMKCFDKVLYYEHSEEDNIKDNP